MRRGSRWRAQWRTWGEKRALAVVLLSLVMVRFASAELPSARLDSISPTCGQIGAEVEVAIAGAELDEAKELRFSHPGITAAAKADKRFVVKVAPEVPPGLYDVRAIGLLGVSNPRVFFVSERPVAVKAAAHTQAETAFALPLGACYSGATTAAAADYFRFTAQKGQRLMIECTAAELDSKLRPSLELLDGEGHEISTSRRGGFLDFTAPGDGAFLLRVRDIAYAGGADYFYQLSVGPAPHLDNVWPPAAPAGGKSKFTVYGRNLPGGSPTTVKSADEHALEKLEVEIDVPAENACAGDGLTLPAAAAVEGFSYRLRTPAGSSNALFIGFAKSPVALEQEPNDQAAEAQKLSVPCEVAGQFQRAADLDSYSFEAKKGDEFWIEVIAHRLGRSANVVVAIQREGADVLEAAGAEPVPGNERFTVTSNDPAARFSAPADGVYRVLVRDAFAGTAGDPAKVYRLAIRPAAPDFQLAAVAEPLPATATDRAAAPSAPLLRAGDTIGIKVVAFRREGFAGPIELCAENLPPGVSCTPTRILAGKNEGTLLLTAAEKVERWTGPLRVLGKATIGEKQLSHVARGGTVSWSVTDYNVDPVRCRLAREFVLAVGSAEAAPIAVAPAEEKVWETAAGGKLEIPLKVTRRGEFKDALKLKMAGAPAAETVKEIEIPAGGVAGKATIDLAANKLPPGEHTVYLQGVTKGKFRGKDYTMSLYSAPIRIAIAAPAAK